MSSSSMSSRARTASVLYLVVLVWLLGLSILVGASYRVMTDQEQVDSGVRQLQRLETQLAELADTVQVLQAPPGPVTTSTLLDVQQQLENRLIQIEQAQAGGATTEELHTLRAEFEQLKARQEAPRAVVPAQPRPARPTTSAPRPEPFLYHVVGVELRAGQRSISLAPTAGELSTRQILVLLPGEVVDNKWRLESIGGNTAVFRSGNQTRQLAIP